MKYILLIISILILSSCKSFNRYNSSKIDQSKSAYEIVDRNVQNNSNFGITKGVIRNLSGEFLHGANITIYENDKFVSQSITNKDGFFELNYQTETIKKLKFIVSYIGYKDFKIKTQNVYNCNINIVLVDGVFLEDNIVR